MVIFKAVQQAFQFVWEGAVRIFGPDKDMYPATGLQPFEGEPYDERKQED